MLQALSLRRGLLFSSLVIIGILFVALPIYAQTEEGTLRERLKSVREHRIETRQDLRADHIEERMDRVEIRKDARKDIKEQKEEFAKERKELRLETYDAVKGERMKLHEESKTRREEVIIAKKDILTELKEKKKAGTLTDEDKEAAHEELKLVREERHRFQLEDREIARLKVEELRLLRKDEVLERREVLKLKIREIQDTGKRDQLERVDESLNRTNVHLSEQYEVYIVRLEEVLNKIENRASDVAVEGVDVSSITSGIASTQSSISLLRERIAEQRAQEYIVSVDSTDEFKEAFRDLKGEMKNDHKVLREELKNIREEVRGVFGDLREILPNETEEDESAE